MCSKVTASKGFARRAIPRWGWLPSQFGLVRAAAQSRPGDHQCTPQRFPLVAKAPTSASSGRRAGLPKERFPAGEIAEKDGLDLARTVYMGDDIPDLDAMRMAGVPVCPADAAHEIVGISAYVSQYPGGKGCVRDIIEQVLRAQGKWLRHTIGMHTI